MDLGCSAVSALSSSSSERKVGLRNDATQVEGARVMQIDAEKEIEIDLHATSLSSYEERSIVG